MKNNQRRFSLNHLDQLENRLCLSTSNDIGTPIAVADFTGDGNIDLLVRKTTSLSSSSGWRRIKAYSVALNILPGNGDGTFGEAIETDISPNQLAATADFNGDGKADLLLNQRGFCIAMGNGDGTFSDVVKIGRIPNGKVFIYDINGDNYADILVNSKNTIKLLLGNGDGTFDAPVKITLSNGLSLSKVADFTGDGNADLLLKGSGALSVMSGNGDGTFSDSIITTEIDGNLIAVADFNGDDIADLMVKNVSIYSFDNTNSVDSSKSQYSFHLESIRPIFTITTYDILLGNADGTFQDPIDSGLEKAPSFVGDFNSDGSADLIYAGNNRIAPTLQLGNGDGSFADAEEITLTTPDASETTGKEEITIDSVPQTTKTKTFSGKSSKSNLKLLLSTKKSGGKNA